MSIYDKLYYRKFHPRLPHFSYQPFATDELTQRYAAWMYASYFVHTIPTRASTLAQTQTFRRRVCEYHRRRFLKAFVKASKLSPPPGYFWTFGATQDALACKIPTLQHELVAAYRQYRYHKQHIPKLP